MPAKIYRVTLTDEEREELTALVSKGKGVARRITRARILLMADEKREDGGWKDTAIVQALGVHQRTVERIRENCVLHGVEAALNRTRPKKKKARKLDGEGEARLVQLACSEAPDGHEGWTMQMLADRLIELEIVETISRETV
ncbi:helix-turn-helix domain-containing protein, partial [Chloroflexota bacterium]